MRRESSPAFRADPKRVGPAPGPWRVVLRRLLAACSALAPLIGSVAQQQPPATAAGEPPNAVSRIEERVEVSLVLVEAVVVDRAGRHVHGLTRDAFTMREAGEVVPIVTFDEIELPHAGSSFEELEEPPAAAEGRRTAGEPPPAEPPVTPAAPTAPITAARPEERQRMIVLLFDGYSNASALHLVQARRAAKKFLRTRMGYRDQAAIYEISPFLRSITGFSNDVAYLEKSVDDIRYFPGESLGTEILDATVYQGYLGSREDITRRILNSAEFGASQQAAERRQYFNSITSLGRVLEELPGKKIIVLFSGGFPIVQAKEDMATAGFGADFRRMIRQLERARTTLYSMNIGEDPALIAADQRSNYRDTLDYLGFGPQFLDSLGRGLGSGGDTSLAYNQVLAVMANESGGRFFPGRNYDRALESVDDDTHHFYLIGYQPPAVEPGRDGRERYRPIDLEVRGKGLRVTARMGRFARPAGAAEESRTASSAFGGGGSASARVDEPVRSETAMPRGLHGSPVYFPGQAGRTLVGLMLRLDGPVKPIPRDDGGLELDISTRVVVERDGVELDRVSHSYRSALVPEALEPLRNGLRLTEAVEVAPGPASVTVVARLNGLGIEATWRGRLDVPALEPTGLGVAGLTVVAGESAPPLVADVFTAGEADGEQRPDPFRLVNDWRVLGSDSPGVTGSTPPTLFFRVYNPEIDPATGQPRGLGLDYVLVPEAGGGEILPPIELAYFKPSRVPRAFDVLVRLGLGMVEPGPYRLRVEARDGKETRASQEVPLQVLAPSNSLNYSK